MVKRGAFAMDNRTGQVVRVAEKGGGNCMVRTAYKSDSYWMPEKELTPVPDPHAWKGGEMALFLVLIVFTAFLSWSGWRALSEVDDTWVRTMYGGVMPGLLGFAYGSKWLGLLRV